MLLPEPLNLYYRVIVEEFLREWQFLMDVLNERAQAKADFTDKLCGIFKQMSSVAFNNAGFVCAGLIDSALEIAIDWANDKRKEGREAQLASLEYQVDMASLRIMVETAALEATRHYQYALLTELAKTPLEGIVPFAKTGVERVLDYIVRRRLPLTIENLVDGFIAGHSGAGVKNFTNTKLVHEAKEESTKLKKRLEAKVGIGGYTAEGLYGRSALMTPTGKLYALPNKKEARHKLGASTSILHLPNSEKLFNYGYAKLIKNSQDPKYGYLYVSSYWLDKLYGHLADYQVKTEQNIAKLSTTLQGKLKTFTPLIVSIDRKALENYLDARTKNKTLSLLEYVRHHCFMGNRAQMVVYDPAKANERDLRDLEFKDADLSDCHFIGCCFGGSLANTNFSRSSLRYSDWSRVTTAEGVNLTACQAEYLKARQVNFKNANFTQANLSYADLDSANLTGIQSLGIILQNTKLGVMKTPEIDSLLQLQLKQEAQAKKTEEAIWSLERQLQSQQTEVDKLKAQLEKLLEKNPETEELSIILANLQQEREARLIYERTTQKTLIQLKQQQEWLTEKEESQQKQVEALRLELKQQKESQEVILQQLTSLQEHLSKPVKPLIDPKHVVPYFELVFGAKVGEGTLSKVYQGYWHQQPVVIKTLEGLSAGELEEFVREVKIMSNLSSRYITQFYGACLEAGRACLVMEYMEQGSLYQVLRKGPLTPERQKQIALEIARGLHYLHSKGILHRNLESTNILLNCHGEAKISDFGLSKTLNALSVRTALKQSQSVQWLAPECFKRNSVYTEQSDIYSYGMIVWEIVTGKVPYQGLKDMEVMAKVFQGESEKLDLPSIPPFYVNLIKACWSQDLAERPSLEFIIKSLEAYQCRPPSPTSEAYYNQGVEFERAKDYVHAFTAYQKSANKGYFKAETNLGLFFLRGVPEVVIQDKKEAYVKFLSAAQKGHVRAMYNLAMMLEHGDGVEKDLRGAIAWYKKAGEDGDTKAQEKYQKLSASLSGPEYQSFNVSFKP